MNLYINLVDAIKTKVHFQRFFFFLVVVVCLFVLSNLSLLKNITLKLECLVGSGFPDASSP